MKKTAARRSKQAPLFDTVRFVLSVLNGEHKDESSLAMQVELRRLVELWLASGPNLVKMRQHHPDLVPPSLQVSTYPLPDGRLAVTYLAAAGDEDEQPVTTARMIFWSMLLTPECLNLGGPCECGCGEFFLRKGKYDQTFIKGHASRKSASKFMQEKQAAKRAPRIRAVKRALAKFQDEKVRGDWKEFVEVEANVTINTLTRWVEKGWIQEPKTGRR